MGGDVEDEVQNADLEGAEAEEVCLREQIFETALGLRRRHPIVEVIDIATTIDWVGEVVVVESDLDAIIGRTFPGKLIIAKHADGLCQEGLLS